MKTLYDMEKAAFDAIAARGGQAIADMARHFDSEGAMSEALLFSRGTVRHWLNGGNWSAVALRRAHEYLAAKQAPQSQPEPTAKPAGVLLLVACDSATAEKIKRVAAILGADVTDV